jgi:flagellar hook-associated protein 3 FlgL
MSGTLNSIYNNASFALRLHGRELLRLQEQASTGSQINRASDAPSDAYRVLNLSSQQRSIENYVDNLSQVMDVLQYATTIISDMKSALADAKGLLSAITSGTGTGAGVQVTIEGINDTLERIAAAANSRHSGKYIFGGTDTATAPYAVTRVNGRIVSVEYQGSGDLRKVEVAPGVESTAYLVGDDLFRLDERGEPDFTGATGAAAGTGTSSVRGDVWMTVTHDGSNYRISIDGGLTDVVVPAGGDANQAVTDSRTGGVLYVDSTGINATGTEWVQVPGTYDVFNTLITLRDRLATDGGLTSAQMEELRFNAFSAIDEIDELLVAESVASGAKIGFLENLKSSLKNLQYNTEDEIARIEDADIAQIAIDLSQREVLYQMSLAMAGKLLSMSLLDFI